MQQITQSGRLSQAALVALWRDYKQTQDTRARDRLVFSLAPIVKAIAYRRLRELPAHREVDDLLSCGLEALIRSTKGRSPSFRAAFDKLPARERRVALLLHIDDLTLRETGEILGVSESRVCQIHGKLKRGLRRQLEADEPLLLDVA